MPLSTEEKLEYVLATISRLETITVKWNEVAEKMGMSSGPKAREKFKRIIEENGTYQYKKDNTVVEVEDDAAVAVAKPKTGTAVKKATKKDDAETKVATRKRKDREDDDEDAEEKVVPRKRQVK